MKKINRIKTVGYVRVSTNNNTDGKGFNSIDAQSNIIKAWVDAHADTHELVEIFVDNSRSGKTMNRPAIKKMYERLAKGDIGLVLSYRMDRISRDLSSYLEFEKVLKKYNAEILYTNDLNPDNSPSGNFLKAVRVSAARYERDLTSRRRKARRLERINANSKAK